MHTVKPGDFFLKVWHLLKCDGLHWYDLRNVNAKHFYLFKNKGHMKMSLYWDNQHVLPDVLFTVVVQL